MEIKRISSQPSNTGPADWFTGSAYRSAVPSKRTGPRGRRQCHLRARRSNSMAHPSAGQTLIITGGCGRAQHEGGPVEEIHPGDVVWFPPGEKHWHGAAPATAMTHIAIQEQLDGQVVEWLDKVSDDQYNR